MADMNASSRLGFYFDQKACIGCRTCQIACKDKNDLPVGVIYRRVHSFEVGAFPDPCVYHYSASCNHCENPACVAGCPTGAMHVADDGTVVHDDSRCIGCQYCVWNCPYSVPQYRSDAGVVGKCDACADLRAAGGNPACVDACVMRCLEFGPLDELMEKHAGEDLTDKLTILPDSSKTNPSLLVNPRPAALEGSFAEKEL
jgi:anaerobic dimethyl sulfoxide reductase subunit B (iron-sulfur subunit)